MKRLRYVFAILFPVILVLVSAAFAEGGVTRISLYKKYSDMGVYALYGDSYDQEWVRGKDITSIYPLASSEREIAMGSHYQDVFNKAWRSFEGWEACKICYRVEFGTSDGTRVDKMIMKPGDELSYSEYLENYLYDDVRVAKNTWYSHLTPEDTGDIIMSSMKVTAGKKIDLINTPIKITACVYSGDGDFDANGFYTGSVSSSVILKRKAVSLKLDVQKNGKSYTTLNDGKYDTSETVISTDTITVKSETPMAGVCVMWDAPVKAWTLSYNGKEISRPKGGCLHDYIEVGGATECTIKASEWTKLCEIRAYSEGELPEDVQKWEAPADNEADILVFSTHADDEVLFFGGAVTLYKALGYKVQVVYMCNYWNGAKLREHEKLDGLWTMGVRAYPVNMDFDDLYSESLSEAKKQYDYDKLVLSVAENIRRFKPLVIVTHDTKGEYGHGGHMILCAALCEAVEKTADSSFGNDSAEKYGVYDVPKTYLHLYGENKLELNLREKMNVLGGLSPIEVEKAAYKKHVSQQWTWFYVDDEYKYSCARFGLYRTTVGPDTGKNDMMENVVSYGEQKRLAEEEQKRLEEEERLRREEEERLKREEEERLKREEEERLKREEEERLKREEEERQRLEEEERLRREEEERKAEEERKRREEESAKPSETEKPGDDSNGNTGILIFAGVLMLFMAVVLCVFVLVPALLKLIRIIKKRKKG
ncbi:MAG: PIG-L family deacetylase [Clostridia bacterium]|nr:PIG-L family deacetylase [Clostridia bacterium]